MLLRNAEPVYRAIEVDPVAVPIAVAYLDALSWGVLPMLGYVSLRYLCDGNSWTVPAMVVSLSGLVVEAAAEPCCSSTEASACPPWEASGCGYASAIVITGQFFTMAFDRGVLADAGLRRLCPLQLAPDGTGDLGG